MTVLASLRSATLSPLAGPRGRLRTASAQANCVGPSTPTVYDSLTPRRAAGPGAHSVGQGLTVTAVRPVPTFDPHTPVCYRSTGSAAHSSAPATVSVCFGADSPCVTGLRGPGAPTGKG